MRIRSHTIRVLTAAALMAGGLTAATTASATAAPATVQSCYGSAKSYATDSYNQWPAFPSGWAYATSNCADINVKPSSGTNVRTCFATSSGSYYCNSYRWIAGGTWGLAATDVKDGTKFHLEFDRYSSGLVAY